MLRKNAALTAVIVASLAIGIGANSAIFSVVDALLLRPLPYPHADRLAAVWLHSPGIGIVRDWPSPGQYIDLQNENHSFEQMVLAQSRTFTLTGRDQPERVAVMRTQSALLQMLGARAQLGRLLLPEEDKPGKTPVAVLSDRVWKRLFNADSQIVGKGITLNGNPVTVAGALVLTRVMASLLFGISATDLLTFCVVAFLLTVVAFAATAIPAQRATRVDPVVALREE